MIGWILKLIFGSKNARLVKSLRPVVARINELDELYKTLSDDALREKTATWKKDLSQLATYAEQQKYLDRILPEAFAAVKNAARRLCGQTFLVCDVPVTWNMVHFDTQLIGGICLHRGVIAEMQTGEGKTLVATLPLFLNALVGKGAHCVTTNDYLARRDGEWMGQIFQFLGLSVGIIQHDQPPHIRRQQYDADITYGMNSEFGFDYLRDHGMATVKEAQVQRGHCFAIVDEVDSILIDEARVPLIISGPVTHSTHQFDRYKPLVDQLVKKQTMLCNRLVQEAGQLFEQGKVEEAAKVFCKVKAGMPRNKGYMRAMEDPEKRRAIEKMELSFYTEVGKPEFFKLKEELFFSIDERQHDADLSDMGREFLSPGDPEAFVLPDLILQFADIDNRSDLTPAQRAEEKQKAQAHMDRQSERIHNISQLLRAYCLFERDVNYIIEEGKVVIVDENTGRKMPGRRWSDGLHQAVEAKEGVQIDKETQTLATITIQNYFRLYSKLAGMTGTAETEANEFSDIYKLDVAVIPTNRPNVRVDGNDFIFKTRREKYAAVIEEIKTAHEKGQPVLVGTASVNSSELMSRMLQREKIPHTVLNARQHQREAEIVAQAGQRGAVTISTNMAGRGTDIRLGAGVSELGGLYVLATERHESRRTDRQLRGRCARQGDPGYSRFFVSFEDDLMRNFGAADRMTRMMERFGMKEGEALEHPWLNASVETAQKRVETRNYLTRKRTLEFDDVMNKQREVIYGWRTETLNTDDTRAMLWDVVETTLPDKADNYFPRGEDPDFEGLAAWANSEFPIQVAASELEGKDAEAAAEVIGAKLKAAYISRIEGMEEDALKQNERYILLNAIDRLWQEHLYAMDSLREGIYLRSFGQKDPLVEYKNEAFEIFSRLMDGIRSEVLSNMFRSTAKLQEFEELLASLPQFLLSADESGEAQQTAPDGSTRAAQQDDSGQFAMPKPEVRAAPARRAVPKVGRNEPCPCGSGKKYKQCCGKEGAGGG